MAARVYDRDVQWSRQRLLLPVTMFQSKDIGGNLSNIGQVTGRAIAGNQFDGGATGGPDTTGEAMQGNILVPNDWNPDFPLGFRVHWITSHATSGSSVTWKVFASMGANDTVMPTGVNATALDTVIALQTLGASTAYLQKRTSRGIKNAGWLSRAQIMAGAWMNFAVELDAVSGITLSTDSVWLLALEIDYMPMRTRFPHSEVDGPFDSDEPN